MSNLNFKKIENSEEYNNFITSNNGSFIQAPFYGDWHKKTGKNIYRYTIEEGGQTIAYIQAIEVNLPLGQKYLYSPYGPVVNKDKIEIVLPFLKEKIIELLKKEDAIFFRLDFNPIVSNKLLNKYFKKSHESTYKGSFFQPRSEWVLDLNLSEEKILSNFHSKTRYSMRVAERHNAKIEIFSENLMEYFEIFMTLMSETASRNSFGIHPKEYYLEVFKSIDRNKNGFLTIAKIEGEVVGTFLYINYGKETMYLYGASSDKYRKVPYSHLAQFESIKYAKRLGIEKYNFGGISSESRKVPSLEALTLYKKRFGGRVLNHSDFFDVVSKRMWYVVFVIKKMIQR